MFELHGLLQPLEFEGAAASEHDTLGIDDALVRLLSSCDGICDLFWVED